MLIDRLTNKSANKLSFNKCDKDLYKVHFPYYHEDGDMFDVFLRINNDGYLELCDFGATLMRLSYTYEFTDFSFKIFEDILRANCIENYSGNLCIATSEDDFLRTLLSYSLTISKIVNMDIMKRDNVVGLFKEQVREYIDSRILNSYKVEYNIKPSMSVPYTIDYSISKEGRHPIYLSAINTSLLAIRAVAIFSNLRSTKSQYMGVVVHNDLNSLSRLDRDAITNATDKQYTSFNEFHDNFPEYLERIA